jgi:glutamyl-tRNA reductase
VASEADVAQKLIVVGVSHRTAPLAVRERLAIDEARAPSDLQHLVKEGGLGEGVLVSTCNRVELLASAADAGQAQQAVTAYFRERAAPEAVEPHLYVHEGRDAVRHLFRVASGLDSMVVGEPQILGQVKDAYALAQRVGTVGTLLGRTFERSFGVAKRVRTETAVASGNVSVSSIACDLAEKIFGELRDRRVLLVGAGKMSEVAAKSLAAQGAAIRVVNRSPERAKEIADACGGTARPLEMLAPELAEADVVISSTAKQGHVITYELMQAVCKLRRHRPLFLIDIAVPRDVDPRVESLDGVFLYDMDDLQKVSKENLAARQRAVGDAEAIIDAELGEHERYLRSLELTPTIVALRARVHALLRAELERTMPKLAVDDKAKRQLEAMCDAMANKLLHAPLTELKQGEGSGDGAVLVQAVQRLFRLDDGAGAAEPGAEAALTSTAKRARGET